MRSTREREDHDSGADNGEVGCPAFSSTAAKAVPALIRVARPGRQFASLVIPARPAILEKTIKLSAKLRQTFRVPVEEFNEVSAKNGSVKPTTKLSGGPQLLRSNPIKCLFMHRIKQLFGVSESRLLLGNGRAYCTVWRLF